MRASASAPSILIAYDLPVSFTEQAAPARVPAADREYHLHLNISALQEVSDLYSDLKSALATDINAWSPNMSGHHAVTGSFYRAVNDDQKPGNYRITLKIPEGYDFSQMTGFQNTLASHHHLIAG